MVKAVRGAVMVSNEPDSIREGVTGLLTELIARNGIAEEEIISIVFSQTHDIDALNPARALRSIGFAQTPLFCTQEPREVGAADGVVRVLLTCATEHAALKPVYLNGAERLRGDLFGGLPQEKS